VAAGVSESAPAFSEGANDSYVAVDDDDDLAGIAMQLHNRGSFAIVARSTVFVVSAWIVAIWVAIWIRVVAIRIRVKERKDGKTEIIKNNDLVETVEATKPIISIEVTIVETVEATKPIISIEVTIVETVEATKPIIPIEAAVAPMLRGRGGV
jgi:hypothetical protein